MNKNRKYLLVFASVALIIALSGSYYLIYFVNVENVAADLPNSSPTNQNPSSSPSPATNTNSVQLLVDAAQLTSPNVTVADGGSVDLNITFASPPQITEETIVALTATSLFRTSSHFNLSLLPDVIHLKSNETKTATLKIFASEDAELGTYYMNLFYNTSSASVSSGYIAFNLTVTHVAIPDMAFINYWLDSSQSYQRAGDHAIIVNCKNNGDANGAFDIIATSINASCSANSSQLYQIINNTAVKISFTLNAAEEKSSNVHFIIDDDVEKFSISLQLESNQSNLFVEPPTSAGGMTPYIIKMRTIEYYWSDSSNSFVASLPA